MSDNPFDLAARCLPWRLDLWEQAAKQASEAGDLQTAAIYLERLGAEAASLGINPENVLSHESLELLANSYNKQGDFGKAAEIMLKIASRTGLDEALAEEISGLYLRMGDFPSAVLTWKQLLAIEPDNPTASYQLGLLLAVQDPDAALPYLEKAAQSDPLAFDTAVRLIQAIGSAGNSSDRSFQLVISGRSLAAESKWELAAEAFQQAIRVNPGYAEAWAYLGESQQHISTRASDDLPADEHSPGFLELQKALELNPNSLAAHTLFSLFYFRRGDNDTALKEISLAIEISPSNPVLVSQRASLLAATGKLGEALAEFERAAKLAPRDPAYLRQIVSFSLAYSYQVEQTALPLARQLAERYPNSPVDLDLAAQALIKMGDLDEAETFLTQALQIDPKYAPAYLDLGLIAILRGDAERSRALLQTAIELDPESAAADQARRLMAGGSP